MVGKEETFSSIPFFWTVLFGKSLRYCGRHRERQREREREGETERGREREGEGEGEGETERGREGETERESGVRERNCLCQAML